MGETRVELKLRAHVFLRWLYWDSMVVLVKAVVRVDRVVTYRGHNLNGPRFQWHRDSFDGQRAGAFRDGFDLNGMQSKDAECTIAGVVVI